MFSSALNVECNDIESEFSSATKKCQVLNPISLHLKKKKINATYRKSLFHISPVTRSSTVCIGCKRMPRSALSINAGSVTKGEGSLKKVLKVYDEFNWAPLSLNNLMEKKLRVELEFVKKK